MDKHSFFSILDKYQDGSASPAEKALIEEYYRRLEMAGTTELSAAEEDALKEALYKQIAARAWEPTATIVPIKRKRYSLVAAAAVLATLIGAGSYFWLLKKPGTSPSQTGTTRVKPHDLPPGHDAAILTLADGHTIILDSANGAITKQGGANVINVKGRVSYSSSSPSTPMDREGRGEVVYNKVSTARGNQYQLILADGSKVWLNSASSLRFPTSFTGNRREVELDGEGYFEIAKNAAKPFHVKTRTQDIEVLGTHFNVNAYNDEEATKTTLLEGKVKVANSESTVKEQAAILQPKQQAIAINNAGAAIHIKEDVDLDQVMAWKNGWFEFDDTEIQMIMRQISRWYDVDIKYETKINTQKYGGRISRNLNLSNILKMLETNAVHFRLEGKTLYVIR